ncbi:MAG TPA: iron-containing alcohol dehydrogenase [Streptosporangiaceae bacterium]
MTGSGSWRPGRARSAVGGAELDLTAGPAWFGAGSVRRLPDVVAATGAGLAVLVTDAGLVATGLVDWVTELLDGAGLTVTVFDGVHANPTTSDLAAGAETVRSVLDQAVLDQAALDRPGSPAAVCLVAVGGGSPIDAAKGIAVAAVNPQRGRDLDYRGQFAAPPLPIVAVPTTAGTGAETNAFGVVTDTGAGRKFYVGSSLTRPAVAILDPELTVGLPPRPTAATGLDALTHAVESYLSIRANPVSDGIAVQVTGMVADFLPSAVADGADREARAQLLLAAHLAGTGMARTGLGLCHAIGHAIGGRLGVPHGEALALVLPQVLRFNAAVCRERIADLAFPLGAGRTGRSAAWNADAAIDAVAALAASLGLGELPAGIALTPADYPQIAEDALADEVLANTPRQPAAADITSLLADACQPRR